ncbi:hypothetical protein BJ912DRAFT_996735 [Pholiota molesta]|nr:hypothetical protein BJ912DRAFT_996735 [Pholiota molesta]
MGGMQGSIGALQKRRRRRLTTAVLYMWAIIFSACHVYASYTGHFAYRVSVVDRSGVGVIVPAFSIRVQALSDASRDSCARLLR